MQWASGRAFVVPPARRLTVNLDDFVFGQSPDGLNPTDEAFLKRRGVDPRKDSGKGVMRRNAVFQLQKSFEPILFGLMVALKESSKG